MKNELSKKLKPQRLRSDDIRTTDESSDWIIVRLHSKVKLLEIKYSDLLSKVHKFISDISDHLEIILPTLSQSEKNKINNDITYFLTTQDSIYSIQLFENFKKDLIDKLYSKDFARDIYKMQISTAISELTQGLSIKETSNERKRSQQSLENIDTSLSFSRKDLTPIRNMKGSPIPNEKAFHNYQKENIDLKNSLSEITKQRDLLKAWKENMIKNPNLDAVAQKIIKELREDNDLLMMKNTCLHSKLVYIVTSVSKFLSVSSRFQKPVREREGYLSINSYENEKHRLEVKLREILDCNNENFAKCMATLSQSPLKTVESEGRPQSRNDDALRMERRRGRENLQNTEKINIKVYEELSKQHNEKIDSMTQMITRLENDNRALKSKYYLEKKEKKQIKEQEEKRVQDILDYSKRNFENQFTTAAMQMETRVQEIVLKFKERLTRLEKIQNSFVVWIKKKTNYGVSKQSKTENKDQKKIQECKILIKSLEHSLGQSRKIAETKHQEVEELKSYSKSLENEIIERKNIIESITKEGEDLKAMVERLETLLLIKEKDNECKYQETEDSREKISTLESEISKQKNDLESKLKEIIEYKKLVKNLEGIIAKNKTDLNMFMKDISDKQDYIFQLESTINSSKNDIETKNKDLQDTKSRIKQLEISLSTRKVEQENLEKDIQEYKNRVKLLDMAILDTRGETETKAKESYDYKIKCKELELSIIANKNDTEKVVKENQELRRLKKDFEMKKGDVDVKEKIIKEQNIKIQDLEKAHSIAVGKIQELETIKNALESSIPDSKSTEACEKDIFDLRETIKRLENSLSQAVSEGQTTTEALKNCLNQLNQTETMLNISNKNQEIKDRELESYKKQVQALESTLTICKLSSDNNIQGVLSFKEHIKTLQDLLAEHSTKETPAQKDETTETDNFLNPETKSNIEEIKILQDMIIENKNYSENKIQELQKDFTEYQEVSESSVNDLKKSLMEYKKKLILEVNKNEVLSLELAKTRNTYKNIADLLMKKIKSLEISPLQLF
ncbi:hypothetical protein SteCoe_27780 [Stentor coeruleus]|uniref:Uncharacterized protein n=1 Tax=Stentor coeruleus TaxID=5963 RepID=A0A1R2B9S7_9CILI|nr:hypothetical protein SteCoe_27780 [Stentor coeruleus]